MKKILIFTAFFGEGHNTAARNLHAGLERAEPSASVQTIDIFQNTRAGNFWRKMYLSAIDNAPWMWSAFYKMLHIVPIVETNPWFFAPSIQKLKKILETEKPDLVCTTYPLYASLIQSIYKRKENLPFKLFHIVTDSISINAIWHRGWSDGFVVPNPDTAKVMQNAGVPEEKIHPLGFPVQLDFIDNPLEPPPLENNQPPRILYMANSRKKFACEILAKLLEHPFWQITVVTGKDESLRQRLATIAQNAGDRVHLLGWVSDVPRLLMTHHLVITKAGGAIVQETIAGCCPVVLNHVVPGQEEGNRTLLMQNCCGADAPTYRDVVGLVQRAFAEDGRLWREWKTNLQKLSKPDSSVSIARFLLEQVN